MTFSGACDSHVHVVGPIDRYPQVAGRVYTGGPATVETLQVVATPRGISRSVIVQPSFYGADNSYLLDALASLGTRGRGVAIIEPGDATPALLQDYDARGVRGVRVNLYSAIQAPARGGRLDEVVATWARSLPPEGWHIEILAPLPFIVQAAQAIADSAAPIVIDHYGLPGSETPDSYSGRRLLELVSLPHVWVKLSAPYRTGTDPLATAPPIDWLAAFLRVAADRCVWGSDWPHTPVEKDLKNAEAAPYREISYKRLFEDFMVALPDATLARRILVENPARLFGFQNPPSA
jgi:predicted TIM-barrel fold metal-dependent hydrolase